MSVYATRDLDYDDCGWDYEEDGDMVDPANLSFDELCNMLHEHCGENEVINGDYSLYVSAEFPDGEWESTYLERHISTTVSDYVRAIEKLYKAQLEVRDDNRERLKLANETIATLRKNLEEQAQMAREEKYAIGENPND